MILIGESSPVIPTTRLALSAVSMDIPEPTRPETASSDLVQSGQERAMSISHAFMAPLYEFCPFRNGDNQL